MFLHCTFYKCLELLFASEFSTRKIYRYFCSDDSCPFSLYHYPPWKSTISSRWESPPPMRGKENLSIPKDVSAGITPAYAGKSRVIGRSDDTKKDHPRLCGEKFVGEMLRKIVEGSPPPMRGKGPHRAAFQRSSRITPAYAGKRILQRLQGCKL